MDPTHTLHPAVQPWADAMVAWRRHFHRFPELSFQEHATAAFILQQLRPLDLQIRHPVAKTGIVATLRNGDGPCIALRADMDALPLHETGDVPFKSEHDGVMHACGHDGHMAILLGTVMALHQQRETWRGTVKFIFQPAEEGHAGAHHMVQEGALREPDAASIFGLHLWNYQPFGTVGVRPGPTLAASDRFTVTIRGKGGHGAAPQGTVDAVYVAAQWVVAAQSIVSRNVDPLAPAVVSLGAIRGGSNFNILADTVEILGTARAYDEPVRQLIKERLHAISHGIGATFGAEIQLDYRDGYPPTVNDAQMSDVVRRCAAQVVGADRVGEPYLSMGGEDMAYFLREVPGCFFFVGSAKPGQKPTQVPHHCSHFDIDERALGVGASVFVRIVEHVLAP